MVIAHHIEAFRMLNLKGVVKCSDRTLNNIMQDFASDSVHERWYTKDRFGTPEKAKAKIQRVQAVYNRYVAALPNHPVLSLLPQNRTISAIPVRLEIIAGCGFYAAWMC